MSPFDLVPAPYRIGASVLAVLAVVAGLYLFGRSAGAAGVRTEWDKAKAAEAQAALRQQQAARDTERAWQTKYQGAIDERTKSESQLAVTRAAAALADDRLRRAAGDFQRRLSEAPAEAARAAAKTAADLLGECSSRYRAVAAAADGHAADTEQCEIAWPE